MAAYTLMLGSPALPPGRSTEWLPWLCVAGAAAGGIAALANEKLPVVWIFRLLAVGLVLSLPIGSLYEHTWSPTEAVLWAGAMGLALLVAWGGNAYAAKNLDTRIFGLLAWVVTAGSAATLGLSGSGLLAQMSGVLAAAAGAVVVMGFIARTVKTDAGTVGALTVFHGALVVQGHHYAELPLVAAVGLLTCLPLAGVALRVIGNHRPLWQRAIAAALVVVVPLAISLAQTLYLWKQAQDSGAAYY
jgi:hypothetical protein